MRNLRENVRMENGDDKETCDRFLLYKLLWISLTFFTSNAARTGKEREAQLIRAKSIRSNTVVSSNKYHHRSSNPSLGTTTIMSVNEHRPPPADKKFESVRLLSSSFIARLHPHLTCPIITTYTAGVFK